MKKYPTPREYISRNFAHLGPSPLVVKAYDVYHAQKTRQRRDGGPGVEYSIADFVKWYVDNRPKSSKRWDVGRKDHSKGYAFGNIEFQTPRVNVKERNDRCGNPGKTHRSVWAVCAVIGKRLERFDTMLGAMKKYKVSRKTVYNHCAGVTKHPGKYGPKITPVRFEWA